MDASDEPVTTSLLLIGAGVGGSMLAGKMAGGQKPDKPSPPATFVERPPDLEEDRRKKAKMAQSVLTKDWLAPTLSNQGVLGIS